MKCKLCDKTITEAITVIPCGHSFCKKCKKGYKGNICFSCGEDEEVILIYIDKFCI